MVLAALEDILNNEKYRVWSQVSCSTIFNDSCKSAWHDYNRLYVDFLITEKTEVKINEQQNEKRAMYYYKPKCIVEYNGAGHNPNDNSQLNRQCNDNIKKH